MIALNPGAFTAIGSWPFTDHDKAVKLTLENFQEIPVWPQLPKTGFLENMYVQYSEGLPCVVIDQDLEKISFDTTGDIFSSIHLVYENFLSENYGYFAISEKYAKGLYKFKENILKKGKRLIVKGQTLGPISLCMTLTDQDKKLVFYNEQMTDAILKCCVCKAVWQALFLKETADNVILFIDEPYLVSFGSAYVNISRDHVITMLNEIIDKLHELDVITGVHCCGNTDWSILADTNVDIINFDAFEYSDGIMLYPEKFNEFLARPGKYLAWGIVPTSDQKLAIETPDSLIEKLILKQDKLASLGVNPESARQKAIITPACGTGSLSEESAMKIIEVLKQVSKSYQGRL